MESAQPPQVNDQEAAPRQPIVDLRVFLAVVITLMISVPVTLLGFSWFVNEIKGALVTAAVSLFVGGFVCILILALRNWIFARLGMSMQTALESMIEPAADSISNISNKEFAKATDNAALFVKRSVARYAWIQSYRTMLGLVGWLFLSFAALAGSAILVRQNELTEQTLVAVNRQTERITEQVRLLASQNDSVSVQVRLLKTQNELVESQNKLLEDQNALSEAARRAFTATELSGILNNISDEIQDAMDQTPIMAEIDGRQDSDFIIRDVLREIKVIPFPELRANIVELTYLESKEKLKNVLLSRPLYGRIVALSRTLRPYHFYDDSGKLVGPLSPERAQLYDVLAKSNIAVGPLAFGIDLSFADFRGRDLTREVFIAKDLRNADFSNARLFQVHFYQCDLTDAKFGGATHFGCSFNSCKMPIAKNLSQMTLGVPPLERARDLEPPFIFEEKDASLVQTSIYKCYYPESDWHEKLGVEGDFVYSNGGWYSIGGPTNGIVMKGFTIDPYLYEVSRPNDTPEEEAPPIEEVPDIPIEEAPVIDDAPAPSIEE